jgi:hypothetical protein
VGLEICTAGSRLKGFLLPKYFILGLIWFLSVLDVSTHLNSLSSLLDKLTELYPSIELETQRYKTLTQFIWPRYYTRESLVEVAAVLEFLICNNILTTFTEKSVKPEAACNIIVV